MSAADGCLKSELRQRVDHEVWVNTHELVPDSVYFVVYEFVQMEMHTTNLLAEEWEGGWLLAMDEAIGNGNFSTLPIEHG